MRNFLAALLISMAFNGVSASIVEKTVDYRDGNIELEGFVAYPEKTEGKLPVVILVHDWTGVGDYMKKRARMLAELGYFAFAIDIYGKGVRPDNPKASGAEAGKYVNDRPLFRQRLKAGLTELATMPEADMSRVAAIGYCFGGTGVLEMVRAGLPVIAVVSFHGSLNTTMPAEPGVSEAKVLICHGTKDSYAPPAQVEALYEELSKAGIDYQLIAYGDAVHSFTNPAAGNDPSTGNAYNEAADRRSWQHMQIFLDEVFAKP